MSAPHSVTIALASINTLAATKLTISALTRYTSPQACKITVGDCGSTDGSLTYLARSLKTGLISNLEVAASGRRHAAWIDHWITTCDTEYLVVIDSDCEIRAEGWLDDMMRRKGGAALVACEHIPEQPDYVDARTGVRRHLLARPGVHLMLMDVKAARLAAVSFEERFAVDAGLGLEVGWDVGGAFMAALNEGDEGCVFMDDGFRKKYRHWTGTSWHSGNQGDRRRATLNHVKMLLRYRALHLPEPFASRALSAMTRDVL